MFQLQNTVVIALVRTKIHSGGGEGQAIAAACSELDVCVCVGGVSLLPEFVIMLLVQL